MGETSKATV